MSCSRYQPGQPHVSRPTLGMVRYVGPKSRISSVASDAPVYSPGCCRNLTYRTSYKSCLRLVPKLLDVQTRLLLRPMHMTILLSLLMRKGIVGAVAALQLSEKGILLTTPSYVWRELVVLHTSFDLGQLLAKSCHCRKSHYAPYPRKPARNSGLQVLPTLEAWRNRRCGPWKSHLGRQVGEGWEEPYFIVNFYKEITSHQNLPSKQV
jgi:hypothetical protein